MTESDSFFGRMFAFASRPMPPEPTGPFQTTAVLLRVFGWIGVAFLAIAVIGVFFLIVVLAFLGALFDDFVGRLFDGWFGRGIAAFAIMAVLVGLALYLAAGGALLYWVGHTYELWRRRDSRALGNLLGLGITSVAVGGFMLLGGSGGMGFLHMGGSDLSVGGTPPLAALVLVGFGVTFLVMHSNAQVKAAFLPPPAAAPPPPPPPTT